MELWYSEFHTENVKLSVRVDRQLFSGESEYQRIDVFESAEFGKFVALDGEIVFSEKDEFIYDEMVTHVPMAVHPNVKNVLIIGGGDGGVAKELIQYPGIESIDVVETDKMFVDVCREIFPEVACGLDEERVHVYYDDGLRFLREKGELFGNRFQGCRRCVRQKQSIGRDCQRQRPNHTHLYHRAGAEGGQRGAVSLVHVAAWYGERL